MSARAATGLVEPGSMRVVITGGGTAGHLIPGLCVADALVDAGVPRDSILFVGAERGPEATMVPDAGYDVELLPGRGIRRSLSRQNLGAVVGLVSATVRANRVLRRRRPHVVLGLGGYASAAVGVWAVMLRRPLVLAEQNARAGSVNRMLARRAAACAVPFDDTDLPNAVVTGNPVRPEFALVRGDGTRRKRAREQLGAADGDIVIAVVSGSLGSTRINNAVRDLAARWSDRGDIVIHHVIGRRDYPEFADATSGGALRYRTVEYEQDVPSIYAAADVAVARSGGGAVAELAMCGVPSVLVPLPIATQDHQRHNAMSLVRLGAAELVLDADLTVDRLDDVLSPIVNDAERRAEMASAAFAAGRPDAATSVAALVMDVAGVGSVGER